MAGANGLLHLALPAELPVGVLLHCLHKGIRDTDGEIGMLDLARGTLHRNELFDIRVIVVQHDH